MDLDASFAEYVAARWSMLYRLATLLAGEARADEVTQAALVQAYLSWSDLVEHEATDDLVKRILAATAASTAGPSGAGSSRSDDLAPDRQAERPTLSEEIDRLLPRQRTVLVLRHYELLSDAEIAETLDCPADTVRADALALETGVDRARLRDELVRRAHEADLPLPPTADLLVEGRRQRRRRVRRALTWSAAAAALLLLGLVVSNLVLGNPVRSRLSGGPGPSPPAPAAAPRFVSLLAAGDAPRIAYSVRRSLHLGGGRLVILPEEPSAIVQTRHWLFVAYLSGAIVRVDAKTAEISPVTSSSRGELVTDPAGNHVAWLEGGRGPAVVAVQSVDAEGSVLLSDEQRFPATPRCCDNPFVVNGITGQGEVIASLPAANKAWAWATPDGGSDDQVREITGLGNGVVSQVTGGGLVVQYLPSHFAFGVLEEEAFLVRGEINAREADFGDPLGRRVVYADTDDEIHVREGARPGRSRRGPQDVRLALPPLDTGFTSARWEDDGHVLLDVADASAPEGALVRCDTETGACELAARFDGPHLLAR